MRGGDTDNHVPRMRPLPQRRSAIVSVLDIGSTKICCMIARLKPRETAESLPGRTHAIEILGYGYQRSRGIKSGVVVDLDQAEQAIRLAVDAAERMAGMTVESLIVTLTAGRLTSDAFNASVSLGECEIKQSDIQRVLAAGSAHRAGADRVVVHSLPIGYALDGNRGIADPRGMIGDKLGVDMHVVTGDMAPVRNLELCVNRCHLQVETIVAAPYAAGLASLADDESELGVACIDMGGGTTTIAVFADGHCVHVDAVPIGGHHVTMDVARGLSTRLQDAERLKTLHGSVLAGDTDERDLITITPVGDHNMEMAQSIPRALLTKVIRPRAEEIAELVRDRLNASGFAGRIGRRIVLTGGASQLTGFGEVARQVFGRNVRLGRPLGITGLPEAARGPAFSAAVGLIIYPQVAQIEQFEPRNALPAKTGTGGYLSRVGRWFKDSF